MYGGTLSFFTTGGLDSCIIRAGFGFYTAPVSGAQQKMPIMPV